MDELRSIANKLRIRSLELAYGTGTHGSHLGGGLSTIEIFATLYGKILNYNVSNKEDDKRDRLIVSKGHCVLAYYSALEYFGFISKSEVEQFEINGSPFHGHATRDISKGIEFSGGSLSMGLSYAIGVAIACRNKGLLNHVYVIVGDGECDEGLIWESLMSASNFKLTNLTVIVDHNKLQYDGLITEVMNTLSLAKKFRSFGFSVKETDGHDVKSLYSALSEKDKSLPNAIIAHTIKGKGVSFMEGKKEWHHSKLSKEQYEIAISEQMTLVW